MREIQGFNPQKEPVLNRESSVAEENIDPTDPLGIYKDKEGLGVKESPVSVEVKERLNLGSVVKYLKEADLKIQDKIVEVFNLKDDDLEEILFNEELGYQVGQLAGMKFNHLLLKGLVEPDDVYIHEEQFDITPVVKSQVARLHRKKVNSLPGQYKKSKAEFLKSYFSELPATITEHNFDDHVEQYFKQRIRQEDSDNIIQEWVRNDIEDGYNYPESVIRITNPKTKKILELNLLLPKGVRFVPATMSYDYVDQRVLRSGSLNDPGYYAKNLKQYSGTQQDESRGFSFTYQERKNSEGSRDVRNQEVRYGDISKTGGMLSLLHEITHSWQKQVRTKGGRYDYEEYLQEVKNLLKDYVFGVEGSDEELKKVVGQRLKKNGVYVGKSSVGSEESKFVINKIEAEDGKGYKDGVVFNNDMSAQVLIASDKLKEYMESYVEEERNAWANAIKMIRFLRIHGIDLEPNLKILKDFKEQYEDPLHSYDFSIHLNDNVMRPEQVRHFKRNKNKKRL